MKDLQFGQYKFENQSVLSREGKMVPVPPKELGLLKLLLRYNGGVVSHQVIEQELWPRQTIGYGSIVRCAYSLRKILSDADRTIVVAVPKQGYRFGLPIHNVLSDKAESVAMKIAMSKPKAYAHFQEAQRLSNSGTFNALARAVELLKKACAADPEFAAARSALADCAMFMALRGYMHPAEAFSLGVVSSERALEIDGNLASAHAVCGWFYCVADDWDMGYASLEAALSLDPDYARALMYLSYAQRLAGMRKASLVSARRAVELDPHDYLHRRGLAWRMFCSGMPEAALEIERQTKVKFPKDPEAHGAFGIYAAFLGASDESLEATKRAVQLAGNKPGMMTFYTYALARAGKTDQARSLAGDLLKDGLPRAPRSHLAMSYVPMGDHEKALELLREARAEKCPWFRGARFDPRLEALGCDTSLLALYEGVP